MTGKEPKDRVGYFTGCLADFRLRSVGLATVDVLTRNGVEVLIPHGYYNEGGQVCCGSPMIRTGQLDIVKETLVPHNVKTFENLGVDTVVSACAGCTLTLRLDYPKLSKEVLGYDYQDKFEVLHTHEYLDRVGLDTKGMKPLNITITYHDSCHIHRGLEIPFEQPRRIIEQLPGVKLVEMDESDKCCGSGGGVRAGRRDLSFLIGGRKAKFVSDVDPDYVVMACPFCEIQYIDIVQRPLGYKVLDLMELIQMAYGAYKPEQMSEWRQRALPRT
jgi:fumarate reductase (CoM/CoB) subunit B